MRLFGGEKMQRMMEFLKVPEDMPIENKMISHSIESAQKKVEGHNFDIRKHLVEYDDVMNAHREVVYRRRRKVLENENIADEIQKLIEEEAGTIADSATLGRQPVDWDTESVVKGLVKLYEKPGDAPTVGQLGNLSKQSELRDFSINYLQDAYIAKATVLGNPTLLRHAERQVYLSTIDRLWMDHLENMRYLREKVSLRGFGQRDPLVEYKNEAYLAFETLLANIRTDTVFALFKLETRQTTPQPILAEPVAPNILQTNEKFVEDVLTGDRELTAEEKQEISDATKEALTINPAIAKLGSEGVVKIRADDDSSTPTPTKPKKPDGVTVIRVDDNDPVVQSFGGTGTQVPTVGRNDPCPCGAKREDGTPKKYKQCCGKNS
jgi:preprotein translocase subunit SecA